VDDNVDGLDAKANHTINHVNQMDGRLQDVHVGVQAANQVRQAHTHAHTHTHTCIPTYIHTHTHTNTHTCSPAPYPVVLPPAANLAVICSHTPFLTVLRATPQCFPRPTYLSRHICMHTPIASGAALTSYIAKPCNLCTPLTAGRICIHMLMASRSALTPFQHFAEPCN